MYANDTLIATDSDDADVAIQAIQRDVNALQKWAHDNKIHVNKGKTKVMYIKPPKKENSQINI